MVVGVCRFVVSMTGNRSLKEKRKILKPLLAHLQNNYKVSAAEVDLHNVPDRSAVAFALVSNDRRVVNSVIDKIMDKIEFLAQVVVLEHDFEITNY